MICGKYKEGKQLLDSTSLHIKLIKELILPEKVNEFL